MLTFGGSIKRLVAGAVLFLSLRPAVGDERRSRAEATIGAAAPAIETANFRIYGMSRLPNAQAIAAEFEKLRDSLCGTWFGGRTLPEWSPKCDVVVHATAQSYSRTVGQDQFATVGSSRVDACGGKITLRRLDIRADKPGWFAAAVPHELTHVVMADEFAGGELPAWADEGMGVLADSVLKQSLHLRDFQAAYRGGTIFRLAELVCQQCYPTGDRIPVFYGQSVSLVKFLVDLKSPADFVRFMHRVKKVGCDAAVVEVYGMGVAELERQWLGSLASPRDTRAVSLLAPADRLTAKQPSRS